MLLSATALVVILQQPQETTLVRGTPGLFPRRSADEGLTAGIQGGQWDEAGQKGQGPELGLNSLTDTL